MDELELLANADERARMYTTAIGKRRVFPDGDALANLALFDEPLPEHGVAAADVLRLLDEAGSPATVASNDPRYFGFVIGATLPAAAAAERLVLARDQCASSFANSPAAAHIERVASGWVLDALDLPRHSATACTLVCIAAARRAPRSSRMGLR
jgi:glutamate/tyrosine decarboxylase-like PLP-dependent enzyme